MSGVKHHPEQHKHRRGWGGGTTPGSNRGPIGEELQTGTARFCAMTRELIVPSAPGKHFSEVCLGGWRGRRRMEAAWDISLDLELRGRQESERAKRTSITTHKHRAIVGVIVA